MAQLYTVTEVKDDVVLLNDSTRLFCDYVREKYEGQPIPLADWERLNRMIQDTAQGRYRLWIVRNENNESIAFAGLSFAGELAPAYVAPEYRGEGLHGKLVDLRLDEGGWFSSVRPHNQNCLRTLLSRNFYLAYQDNTITRYVRPLPIPSM